MREMRLSICAYQYDLVDEVLSVRESLRRCHVT
jgi:hypothetical protein